MIEIVGIETWYYKERIFHESPQGHSKGRSSVKAALDTG